MGFTLALFFCHYSITTRSIVPLHLVFVKYQKNKQERCINQGIIIAILIIKNAENSNQNPLLDKEGFSVLLYINHRSTCCAPSLKDTGARIAGAPLPVSLQLHFRLSLPYGSCQALPYGVSLRNSILSLSLDN